MKEVIIIILILLIIFFGGLFIQKYLNSSSSKLVNQLSYIKELIKKDIDNAKINDEANKLYNNWRKIEKGWSIIVLHEELDLIEQALIEAKDNLEQNKKEEGKVAIEKSIFLIKHIPEKEKVRLKNIF